MSRANTLNLETGVLSGSSDPYICSTLYNQLPNRQIDYTVVVVQGNSLDEPTSVPGKDTYFMKYLDGLVDATEIARKYTNVAMTFNIRGAKLYTGEANCFRWRTATSTKPTGPGMCNH